jgi:hypothetical protein
MCYGETHFDTPLAGDVAVTHVSNSGSSYADTRAIAGSSKANGKKRAIDDDCEGTVIEHGEASCKKWPVEDDEDATATDNEAL